MIYAFYTFPHLQKIIIVNCKCILPKETCVFTSKTDYKANHIRPHSHGCNNFTDYTTRVFF